ncbi:MAG: hypothetical protein P1U42_05255 [Phycisphaerales bacterium]|nr:hypothetical protein [Phycisphaerales bacterium]
MNAAEKAFLTVISWPSNFDEDARVDALVSCAGMDLYQAKLASRRNTPGIMLTIDASVRKHVVNALHDRSVLCIAPTSEQIQSYPEPIHALGIDQFPDSDPPRFVIKTTNETPWTFTSEQVKLVVWGRLKSTSSKIKGEDRSGMQMSVISPEVAIFNAATQQGAYISKNIKVKEIVDFHIMTDDGIKLVRLIGPRTRIGIMGDDSPPSLLDNSLSIDLIEVLMPYAYIDREFHDFDPPSSVRAHSRKHNSTTSSATIQCWMFYSPWIALIREAVGG